MEDLADICAVVGELLRAASMSETVSIRPSAEPGAAEVTPLPKMTEHSEPGGVTCTTR